MTARRASCTSFAIATALLVAACGGGGKKASTTTSSPPSSDSTSSSEPATTSSTIDPTLKDLLLVAADLPGFKEASNPGPDDQLFKTCDPAEAPAFKAVYDAPKGMGGTFVRGKDDAVQVKSIVFSTTDAKAEAGLTELLDAKALSCLEKDVQAIVEKDKAPDSTVTAKLTSAKSTVAGVDQAVLLSATVTIGKGSTGTTSSTARPTSTTKSSSTTKAGVTTTIAGTTTIRLDAVFLRSAGTILEVDYSGPTALATAPERQKIVAVAARKLAEAAAGPGGATTTTTSTTAGTGTGSSTSSTKGSGSSTTRHPTSTTRQGTSTTKKAITTTTVA